MNKKETDIPCSNCNLWNPQAKVFSCEPNGCKKLSTWLMEHASQPMNNMELEKAQPPIQYVV